MKTLLEEFKIDGAKNKVGFIKWSDFVDHSYTVRFTDNLTGTGFSLTQGNCSFIKVFY